MAKSKVIDVILLSMRIPNTMSDRVARTVLHTLASKEFASRLRGAVRLALDEYPTLNRVTITTSR